MNSSDSAGFSASAGGEANASAYSGTLVLEARDRIRPFTLSTPILTSKTLDQYSEAHVFLKCENFQRTGSFKFRGACNAVASLSKNERDHGVITHSSGNFAQALALAAQLHNVPSYVVMPGNSADIKIRATAGYGAAITLCEPTPMSRHETADRIRKETGATFLHPSDDPRVFAGQGTACLELLEELGELDVVLAPLGGGGLLSGTALIAKHLFPSIQVIGCEPAAADDAFRSLRSGHLITDFTPHTLADGLRTSLGENTFRVLRDQIDDVVLVSEADMVSAMRFVWERMKIIIEPSSAVAIAPLLNGSICTQHKRVGVIISGGNVDLEKFFSQLAHSAES